MKSVFLSASVPFPEDTRYFEEGKTLTILEATIALADFVLPQTELVLGGGPVITPIIKVVADRLDLFERVHIFQSAFFREKYLPGLELYRYIEVQAEPTKDESLLVMRRAMIQSAEFSAAIFIGGMESVADEWWLFGELNPTVPRWPVATTGGAAKQLWAALGDPPEASLLERQQYYALTRELGQETDYAALFPKLLC